MEKLLERLEKRVRGALARIDELGQENETLTLRIDELTAENVRLYTELLDKDSELGDIEELRSRLEDSQARQELVRLRLNDIISELDTALGITEDYKDTADSVADEVVIEDGTERESTDDSAELSEEEFVSRETADDDLSQAPPPQIQPITDVEWGDSDEDSTESISDSSNDDDEQTEMMASEENALEESEEQEDDPPPELKDEANPLGLFGGVLDRKTDDDANQPL